MSDWLLKSWWVFNPADPSYFSWAYRWMNLLEGTAWCVLAVLVLWRFAKHRRSRLELLYAAAFATFGLSDFREAYNLQTWLILAKGANLIALLWLRAQVIGRFYPGSRVY